MVSRPPVYFFRRPTPRRFANQQPLAELYPKNGARVGVAVDTMMDKKSAHAWRHYTAKKMGDKFFYHLEKTKKKRRPTE